MLFLILSFLLLLPPSPSSATTSSASLLKLPLLPFPSSSLNSSSLLQSPRHRGQPNDRLPLSSAASLGSGQYLVHISLGTPPQPLLLIADTGSDLLFSRCSFARQGHHLNHSRLHPPPSFLPLLSSSFRPLHCSSPFCRLLPHLPCNHHRKTASPCRYSYSYSDLSSSSGFLSLETSPNINNKKHPLLFGCATSSSFPTIHGVLGLGNGPLSLPSQLSSSSASFSYCLVDYTLSPPPLSYLTITTSNAIFPPRRPPLTFTPFVSNPLSPTYYYVQITAVSVDAETLPIHPSVWKIDRSSGAGGVIIDSGTTLSFFPQEAYTETLKAMRKAIPKKERRRGPAGFDLCIDSSAGPNKSTPALSLHFAGGGKMAPPARNYFVEVEEGVRCLGIRSAAAAGKNGFGVIGNLMQQGFLMVFDRRDSRLGFHFTECAGM